MKLKSGHEVQDLEEDENAKQKKLFTGYSEGMIRLQPGNWFFKKKFQRIADKVYDFKFKPSDVVVMTFPKCGTTWMQEIIWNMKHPEEIQDPVKGVSLNTRCTFLEADFLMDMDYSMFENLDPEKLDSYDDVALYFAKYCQGKDPKDGLFLQIAENIPEPRILKTHLPFSLLAPNLLDTCKVVFVVRNAKDTCVSFFHHSRIINPHGYIGDLDQFCDFFLDGDVLFGPYWPMLKEGWKRKDHPNFHLVHFEDLKADPVAAISSLNQFLGQGLSKDTIEKIADVTHFKKMKERDPFTGNPDKDSAFVDKSKGSFFRSGTVGSWKRELSKEQEDRMDAWIKKNTEKGETFLHST